MVHNDFKLFKKDVEKASNIVVFVGAGLSTESGVPDYRSPNGVWTKYKPVYYSDFISSHEARKRYWKIKIESFDLYQDVKPNIGHEWIYSLEKENKLLGLITQNIDGLHRIVGHSPQKFIEIHGTDREVICLECKKRWDGKPFYEDKSSLENPPKCDECDGFLKSATISFGQPMDESSMFQAREWTLNADLFIVVGSSLVVQPAASFPVIAKSNNINLAIINRESTPYDHLADHLIQCEIGELASFMLEQ
tara:strand:- start:8107 stop:8856 length:750 start_codon:yes stop_codon:yes gene_type:complete